MMEIAPGVYASSVDPDGWDPDPEVGGFAHVLFQDGQVVAGLWRADPDEAPASVEVEIPARETILVLEGRVRFGVAGQPPLELGVGEMASVPKGRVVWHPGPGSKVFWFYA